MSDTTSAVAGVRATAEAIADEISEIRPIVPLISLMATTDSAVAA